jgi:hypothetical protein
MSVNDQLATERRVWWFIQLSPPAYHQWLAACPSTANQKTKKTKRIGVVMAVIAQSTPV